MARIQRLKLLIALLLLPAAVFAQPILTTKILHQPISFVVPDYRTVLNAVLRDEDSIQSARCFFRTNSNTPYLLVPMVWRGGDQYTCVLPALDSNAEKLEYLLLVVNGKKQVIRSRRFSASVSSGEEIPDWQISGIATDRIAVYSEFEVFDSSALESNDDLYDTTFTQGERYGLLVDIYAADQIPAELNAAHGYFGGFAIDSDNAPPRPVKGYGIGLKQQGFGVETGAEQPGDSLLTSRFTASAPGIGGNDWSGFFQTTGTNNRQSITASISQSGSSVTMVTSKSGLGHRLVGSINSSGHMLLYDQYDGEDWTTHYGPATSTHVAIYDYICPTCSQLNEINVRRSPPLPLTPAGVSASDGLYLDRILVSWSSSSGANDYGVYRCTTSSTSSCSSIASLGGNAYNDTGAALGTLYYYRIKACNSGGCSGFSNYDTGYLKTPDIVPILQLLLLAS